MSINTKAVLQKQETWFVTQSKEVGLLVFGGNLIFFIRHN